jgi:DNA-binding transcriptional regulator PaaX
MFSQQHQQGRFKPLVEACAEFGIRRTQAFRLAKEGALDVFKIGRRTFCYVASIESLPKRVGRQRGAPK